MDATMVAKLRAAGAIILGKTNLDEYAPAGIARSGLGGQTCNPYDTKRIPGGSSAGSRAAGGGDFGDCPPVARPPRAGAEPPAGKSPIVVTPAQREGGRPPPVQ